MRLKLLRSLLVMAKEYAQIIVGGNSVLERPWQMTFTYRINSFADPEEGTLASLLVAWIPEGMAALLATLPAKASVVTLRAQSIGGNGFWPVEIGAGPLQGTRGAGETLPAGTGPLALIRSSFPQASARSYTRVYWPLMQEADQEDGALYESIVSDIQTFFSNIDNLSDSPLEAELGVYSKLTDQFFPSASVVVADRIARIRRRGRSYQGRASA
jgi:hypothetical protein